MKNRYVLFTVLALLCVGMLFTGTGCKKKVTPPPVATAAPPPPPPPPPPPAPTISITASPNTITRGQSATLRWNSTNASSVNIDGNVGTVEASGSRSVSPQSSTTYTATASGPGGRNSASARITVSEPPPPPPPPARTITDTEFFSTRVQDVFFDYDKYNIRDDARMTLNNNARAFSERSHIRFLIEGHCDERGSEKYNLALGDKRANSARDHLVSQGISSSRIETVSLGEERPFAQGHNEEAWAQNRRGHFVMK